jgi:hypothetical protein
VKGGSTAGKAPDWWKKLQDKETVKSKKSQEKANVSKESDSDDSHTKKAGIAVAEGNFSSHFEDRHISCPAIDVVATKDVEEKCSVLWNSKTNRDPGRVEDIRPMTMTEHTEALEVPDIPFYVNSGTTSHCSPVCADFIELAPITTQDIKGMNGSCISVIGKGTIKMKSGKGKNLILRNVLYIPHTTL